MIDLDDTRAMKARASLRHRHELMTATLNMIEEGPYPLPHGYRERVIADLNYRSGRLAALISLPADILRAIDLQHIEAEAEGAWHAFTAAEALRTAYLYEPDYTNTDAARYYH